MRTTPLIKAYRTLAIVILILGIIHNVATFTPLVLSGLSCLTRSDLKAMIFMSLGTGSSFILYGILLLNLKVSESINSILIISAFLAIFGILAVVLMPDNPFAYISLIVLNAEFIIALSLRKNIKKYS